MKYIKYIIIILAVIALGFIAVKREHIEIPIDQTRTTSPVVSDITYINASSDLITVELPFPGAVTGKTFGVIGKARGYWFFEGSFPVEVYDAQNTLLSRGIAHAEGPWMTTDFVSFKADISVPQSYIGKARLVLKKDNPSDDPTKDASISFPFTIEY